MQARGDSDEQDLCHGGPVDREATALGRPDGVEAVEESHVLYWRSSGPLDLRALEPAWDLEAVELGPTSSP